jgi:drug/metabolite transporter (DMT)-like permease
MTAGGPRGRRPAGPAVAPLVGSFAAVYLIWGSTYLAIRVAIETIPPLAMAGMRFLLAGAILFPIAWLGGDRRGDRLTRANWGSALVIGTLLLVGGNGGVTLGEEHVPSGVAALLVATVPLWMAAFAHLRGAQRLTRAGAAGLLTGFAGVAVLLNPGATGGAPLGWLGFTLLAPISWAAGSIFARTARTPRRPLLGVAMEMLCAGAILCVIAALLGEWGHVHVEAISLASGAAFAWLVVAGSLVAYTAYVHLLRSVSPRAASSYAYVNPLVAVVLGWAFLGEPVTWLTLLAAALIVVAVAVLLASTRRRAEAVTPAAELRSEQGAA